MKTVLVKMTTPYCPYSMQENSVICMALGNRLYHPSAFQEAEYCCTNRFHSCPFYSLAVSNGSIAAHSLFREKKAG